MFLVFGFYKFKRISSLKKMKTFFEKEILKNKIRGTIIFSTEGINGTIAGKKNNVLFIESLLKRKIKINNFDSKSLSFSKFQPFHRGKVKIKKEVVPMGIKVSKRKTQKHLEPSQWNKFISNKKTILIDARKPFEYKVGTFKGSINPEINNFREFPHYLKKLDKKQSIAMFCTGGIRCEKASVYLEKKGFNNVYQLKGGIINYLKKINKKKSLWRGECYVFDNRISLKHGLSTGTYSMCSGCRIPISTKDKKSRKYEEGVSCPNCHDILTNSQKERFRMRQKQINVAKKLGRKHIFQKEF